MRARREALRPPKRGKRRQRRVILVVAEGETEVDYLRQDSVLELVGKRGEVSLSVARHHKGQTDPASLVKAMKAASMGREMQRDDERWVVMDVDEWTDSQIDAAVRWASEDRRHHLAVSNPRFELYLRLHFERGAGMSLARLDDDLRRLMPDGFKRLRRGTFGREQVMTAMRASRSMGGNDGDTIPEVGTSSFHLLMESVLSMRQ